MMVARSFLPALVVPLMAVGWLYSSPAQAMTFTAGTPDSATFRFEGVPGLGGTGDLAAELRLELIGSTGFRYEFRYTVSNLAGGDFSDGRITGFGLDVSAAIARATATGLFDRVGSGRVTDDVAADVCFMTSGRGCDGGGGGLRIGDRPVTGGFTLEFARSQSAIEVGNAFLRWRKVTSAEHDVADVPVVILAPEPWEPAPEPATWALFISGFGAVGLALRRRRLPTG